ncbi:UDP-N-acetylglucosamine transferase subunit ALG14 [Grifola frondosa]|uniref:UDP-N-acetylglucosamine transferase subunit ALG14 n=1 Tax=Grifola frondosa TaxID=5627 RepID=A0A1C7LR71_GRIFR|nr:UDP-N-acetylglucosamine transferase subunit ALG14 [Grifola frondosa]
MLAMLENALSENETPVREFNSILPFDSVSFSCTVLERMHLLLWCGLLGAAISTLVRLCSLKPRAMPAKKLARKRSDRCSLAVFLGSGGHTSEALMLISALDFDRYSPRTYIISHGDVLSTQKAVDLESDKAADSASYTRTLSDKPYTFVTIPRARPYTIFL